MAFEDRKFSLDKQPAEKLTVGVDFANDLDTGEAIASIEVSAIDVATGLTDNTVLDGAAGFTGSTVSQKIKAGADGKRYKITYKATTDAPHIFEADIIMTVQEL